MYEDITVAGEKEKILSKIKALGINTDAGSFSEILVSPIAHEFWESIQRLTAFADIITLETSSEEQIIGRCRDFGIERKSSQKASGWLTFFGEEETIVPAGTVCKTADGRRYITNDDAIISNGRCIAEAESEKEGKAQNTSVGEIIYFEAKPDGITAVTNEELFIGGEDVESIDSMKERFFQKVRYAPASGNAEDYRRWALECRGVYGVRVVPLHAGAGTVKIVLRGADNTVVGENVVEDVKNHIEQLRPVGANVTVVSCEEKIISVSADIKLSYEAKAEDVISEIKTQIKEYFSQLGNDIIYVSKITHIIMGTGNVEDCRNVRLNGVTEDIVIGQDEVPVLGEAEIGVIEG